MNTSELVKSHHLDRKAIIYIRQSSPHQVLTNQESLKLQYALKQRAVDLGWHENSIEIIDADLGLTGSTTEGRHGFKDLLAKVTLGHAGIILSYEVTRLSRNCSDWYPLLDVCGMRSCLIGDRDGIYDPGTPNGRLLLGLKGQISEMELHTLKGRLTAGIINKAKRGELVMKLPAGFIRDKLDQVLKDPNMEVQGRIQLIFDMFLKLKSASKVLMHFKKNQLTVPRTDYFGDIVWRRASYSAIYTILNNPTYAGTFVYGRTRRTPKIGSIKNTSQKTIPAQEWKIRIDNKYPAYISLEIYEKIQSMLKDNHAEYDYNKTRGVVRQGKALLHGIVYCGECGHKMTVQYKTVTRYLCDYLRKSYASHFCQHIPANPIDDTVVAAFFEALSPIEIDVYTKAMSDKQQQDDNLNRSKLQQIERLRYHARLAERQFNQVDPDNRLVAAELERRWESALNEFKQAEMAFEQEKQTKALPSLVSQKIKSAFQNIGKKIPDVWQQNLLSQEQKKSLLRCLIDKIVINRTTRDNINTRVIWKGGDTTTIQIPIKVQSLQELSFFDEMEKTIIELTKANKTDQEIAEQLTLKGFRSPHKQKVLPSTVQSIRLKHRLFQKHRSHPLIIDGFLTISEISKLINVSKYWIYDRINNGTITVKKTETGKYKNKMYLFSHTEETVKLFLDLKNGILNNLNFL